MDTSRQWSYINGLNGGGCLDYGRCHSLGLVARFICVPFDPSWMNEWMCVCLWKFSELQKVDRPKAQCVVSKNVCLYKRASERIARVTKKGNEMKQDKMGKLFGTGPIVVVWASLVFSHFSLDRRLECNSWNDRRNNGTHWICCAMGDTHTHMNYVPFGMIPLHSMVFHYEWPIRDGYKLGGANELNNAISLVWLSSTFAGTTQQVGNRCNDTIVATPFHLNGTKRTRHLWPKKTIIDDFLLCVCPFVFLSCYIRKYISGRPHTSNIRSLSE